MSQFELATLSDSTVLGIDFSITNVSLITILNLCAIRGLYYLVKENRTKTPFIVPSNWQLIFEKFYCLAASLLVDILTVGSEKYFPLMFSVFMFIVTNNMIGLVPYSFTVTSHLTVTFLLSFSIFIGLNIIGFQRHGMNFFSLFLPANTGLFLALLLVPIEIVSYIAKPISLGARLFINLMAGHSLLKVIAWFSWNLLLSEGVKSILFILPLLILVPLIGLELGVALIQAYVFLTLTLIYLNDVEALKYKKYAKRRPVFQEVPQKIITAKNAILLDPRSASLIKLWHKTKLGFRHYYARFTAKLR